MKTHKCNPSILCRLRTIYPHFTYVNRYACFKPSKSKITAHKLTVYFTWHGLAIHPLENSTAFTSEFRQHGDGGRDHNHAHSQKEQRSWGRRFVRRINTSRHVDGEFFSLVAALLPSLFLSLVARELYCPTLPPRFHVALLRFLYESESSLKWRRYQHFSFRSDTISSGRGDQGQL